MDTQTLVTVVLIVPAVVLFFVSRGRTSFGIDLRDGALGEFLAGLAFSVPFLVVLGVGFPLVGLSESSTGGADRAEIVGIWVYFLILFAIEEVVFRGLLMSGLGPDRFLAHGRGGGHEPRARVGAVAERADLVLGQRWLWNSGVVTLGFHNSAFSLDGPAVTQRLTGPDWLTGGGFGVEGGLVGVLFLVVMGIAVTRFARGCEGPWEVQQVR